MINYDRMVQVADRQIKRFGKPALAKLRRNGDTGAYEDRPCTAALADWKPSEKGLRLEGAVRVIISTIDPTTQTTLETPPNFECDLLVFNDDIYRLVKPDEGERPGGVVMYHDFEAVLNSRVSDDEP